MKYVLSVMLAVMVSIALTQRVVADELSPAQIFECKGGKKISAAEAAAVRKRAQERYKTVTNFQASFTQESYLAALDASEQSGGTMKFSKPGRMRWDYTLPERQVFVLANNVLTLHQPEEKQLVIDEFTHLLISDLPVSFILGLGDLARDFDLGEGCKMTGGTVIELKPKNQPQEGKNGLNGFKLFIDAESNLPKGARIIDVGGNITSIVFRDLNANAAIDEKEFHLEAPPGTDIIDRRQ